MPLRRLGPFLAIFGRLNATFFYYASPSKHGHCRGSFRCWAQNVTAAMQTCAACLGTSCEIRMIKLDILRFSAEIQTQCVVMMQFCLELISYFDWPIGFGY